MKNCGFLLFSILLLFVSCKKEKEASVNTEFSETAETVEVKYAKGFEIKRLKNINGYKLIIKNPWPESDMVQTFYLQAEDPKQDLFGTNYSVNWNPINIPIKNLVATSTTHIPPLVLLDASEKLIGFPATSYISSEEMRGRIDMGHVEDLGANESINVESTIAKKPDIVMGYGIDSENPTYDRIARAGVPIIFNADWTEQHPLGRAEWIKVFGILFDKEKEAFDIFNQIENDYLAAKSSVAQKEKPTVMAGATWKNTWYLPYGNSWQGILINDAGGDYIYKSTSGSGSLAYNVETVLKDARTADYWIAPGQYTSYRDMRADNKSYELFKPFQNHNLYTFALRKGATGGVIYYEEASMRPDLVLQDLISIFHGDGNDDLYFFDPLEN
jgi:iron complex transport system substrate-binding protein